MAMLRISPLAQCFVHIGLEIHQNDPESLIPTGHEGFGIFSVTSTSLRYWLYQIMYIEQVEIPFAEVRYGNADMNTIRKISA